MMKRIYLSLIVLCACFMVACGNAEVKKINKLVVEATEQTKAAVSAEQVAAIATNLQEQMDKIAAEAGEKFTLGTNADSSLAKYKEAAQAKLAEFGIVLE